MGEKVHLSSISVFSSLLFPLVCVCDSMHASNSSPMIHGHHLLLLHVGSAFFSLSHTHHTRDNEFFPPAHKFFSSGPSNFSQSVKAESSVNWQLSSTASEWAVASRQSRWRLILQVFRISFEWGLLLWSRSRVCTASVLPLVSVYLLVTEGEKRKKERKNICDRRTRPSPFRRKTLSHASDEWKLEILVTCDSVSIDETNRWDERAYAYVNLVAKRGESIYHSLLSSLHGLLSSSRWMGAGYTGCTHLSLPPKRQIERKRG